MENKIASKEISIEFTEQGVAMLASVLRSYFNDVICRLTVAKSKKNRDRPL